MLQVILGVIRCISDFQQPCVAKTAGLRAKHTPISLCYPVLCGHCLPSSQAERQAPGLLVLRCQPNFMIDMLVMGEYRQYLFWTATIFKKVQIMALANVTEHRIIWGLDISKCYSYSFCLISYKLMRILDYHGNTLAITFLGQSLKILCHFDIFTWELIRKL